MLGEEFIKEYPLTKYHGVYNNSGLITAEMYCLRVSSKIYGIENSTRTYLVDESELHDCVLKGHAHQKICPIDKRNTGETKVMERALREVQAEKLRLGISLDRPLYGAHHKIELIWSNPAMGS